MSDAGKEALENVSLSSLPLRDNDKVDMQRIYTINENFSAKADSNCDA